ncbi:MAG: hypothetical protein K8T26_20610 [Lentisphaerae bacterium]|nr:hypothetical protein [Lentisphaerota bacterium]
MATEDTTVAAEVADFRARLARLEVRVGGLERAQGLPVGDSPAMSVAVPSARPPDATAATLFLQVAVLAFALLGALILRVLTQQGMLGQTGGTRLGFIYAGGLMVFALLPGPRRVLSRAADLLPCAAVMLAFAIALESALRAHTLPRLSAMMIVIGCGLLMLLVGGVRREASLAAVSALGSMLALVALGLDAAGLAWQLAGLVGMTACATGASWRRGLATLRPLVWCAAMLLLGVGLLLARQQNLPLGPVLLAAAALVAVAAAQHVVMRARLEWAAVWLPTGALWLALLAQVADWPHRVGVAAWVAVAATILLAALRLSAAPLPALAGLAVTASVAGVIGWSGLDPGGALAAVAGLALWQAAGRSRASWSALPVALLMLAGAGTGLVRHVREAATWPGMASGVLLAAILLVHYQRTGRTRADVTRGDAAARLSPAILAGGLLVALAVSRALLHRWVPEAATFLLAQTGLLAAAAMALSYWGHMGDRRPVVYSGLGCMLVAMGKVVLLDLVRLKDVRLLAAVVMLGLASVVVSRILRRRV